MKEKKKKKKEKLENEYLIYIVYLRRGITKGIMNCFKWIWSRYRVPPWISFMPIDSSVLLYRGEEDCASARFIPRGRRSQELASFIKYLLNHRKDISPTWRPWIDLLSSPHTPLFRKLWIFRLCGSPWSSERCHGYFICRVYYLPFLLGKLIFLSNLSELKKEKK